MSETQEPSAPAASEPAVQSPPPTPAPAHEAPDPRGELNELATQLSQKSDRRLLTKFLKLRRAAR